MRKRNLWQRIVKSRYCYLSLLPTFVFLIIFAYYPPLSAIYHSFFQWNIAKSIYIGLGNFRDMVHDEILLTSIWNMVKLTLFNIFFKTLLMPLFVAELIFNMRYVRLKYYYRLAFVIPMVIPTIVIYLIWQFVYDPYYGVLNAVLGKIGLGMFKGAWLGDPNRALGSLMWLGFPWVSGVTMLIYLAGLQSIPQSILESATLDGATYIVRFLRIDLPLIMGQIKLMIVLGVIGGLQGFGLQLVLTQGGPGTATMVPGMHMYQNAFTFEKMGYACAIGFAMFVVMLILTYVNMKYIRSSAEYVA